MESTNYSARFKNDIYAALGQAAKDAGVSINVFLNRLVRVALNVTEQDKADLFIRQRLAKAA